MPIIKKFKRGVYEYSNLFKIKNPSVVVGDSEVKEITPFRGVIQTRGDVISADDFNEIQKNNVYFVKTEYSENHGSGIDAYVIKNLQSEQGLFEGLKIKFIVPKTNAFDNPVVVFEDNTYPLKFSDNENIKSQNLKKDSIINIVYAENFFLVELVTQSNEKTFGIAKIYSESEAETDIEKVKEIIEKDKGNQKEYVEEKMTLQEFNRRVSQGEKFEGAPRSAGRNEPGLVIAKKATGETVWSKLIKTLDHTKILTIRGLIKFIGNLLKPAGENEYGLTTNSKIKNLINEHAPRPDLSPYIPFSKGYRNSNDSDWVVRANSTDTWTPNNLNMYDNSGTYSGSFHVNGGKAYYKVPNRNGGNWCEIMDGFDMSARDNKINNIEGQLTAMNNDRNGIRNSVTQLWSKAQDLYYRSDNDTVRDIRLVGHIAPIVAHANQATERVGYVVTGLVNGNNDHVIDQVQMRAFQIKRGGSGGQNWYTVPFG